MPAEVQDAQSSSFELRCKWTILGVAGLCQCTNMFHRTSLAAISTPIISDLGLTATQFGHLAAVYFYVYAAMQFLAGIMGDLWGSRRTLTLGTIIGGIGALFLGASSSLGMAYVSRLIVGLGVSVIYVNVLRTVRLWFGSRGFATASGLATGLGTIGGILAATPLAWLSLWIGWRWSLEMVGMLSLLVAGLTWVVIRDHPALPEPTYETPEDRPPMPNLSSTLRLLGAVIANPRSWPCLLMGMGMYSTQITFAGAWGVPYLTQVYGMSRPQAADYTMLVTMGMLVGQGVVGFMSDKLFKNRRLPLIAGSALNLVCWLILAGWGDGVIPALALYPLCLIIGIATSPNVLIFPTIVAENAKEAAGMALGFANTGLFVGTALLQPLFGWILEFFWQGKVLQGLRVYPGQAFQVAFLSVAFFALMGLVASLLIRETRHP
jgi:sugar phosphate permease